MANATFTAGALAAGLALAAGGVGLPAIHAAEAVGFAARPACVKRGDGVRIEFAAAFPTDCEVAVVDAASRVVRHLAAGLLGATNTAAAPLAPGLRQSIAWDGCDDFGRAVAGQCQARIRLGTTARLGKVLFHEPGLAFCPRAATVGPDGLVYVLQELGQAKTTVLLEAYTQDGKYVRTVMPYPANLPDEKLAGLPRARLADGRMLPAVHQAGFRDLYPDSTGMRAQRMPISSKGEILLVNSSWVHNGGRRHQRVLAIGTDGGTPRASFLGPPTSAEKCPYGYTWLALSPDERWIYASGQLKDGSYDDGFGTPPHQVVYRIGWDDKDLAKPFVGELYKPGNDDTHLNAPRGIDTDAQGRLYVCDWGNNRVAVFDADGKWAAKLDVAGPDQVAVDRRSGAVYVLTQVRLDKNRTESKLVKFPGLGQPAGAEVDIGLPYCTLSLDASGGRVNLWLARTFGEGAQPKRGVERVTDEGGKLLGPVEVIKHRALTDPYQIAASMATDDVFVHGYSDHAIARLGGLTGEVLTYPKLKGHDVSVGPNGELAVLQMTSYSPSLVDVTLHDRTGTQLRTYRRLPGNQWGHGCTGSKGFCVSPQGDVLVIGRANGVYGVWVFGADGTLKQSNAVARLCGADGSPMMDLGGNFYVAAAAKPAGELMPAGFDPLKPPTPWYLWMYGSVIKFPPTGGRLLYREPAGTIKEWPTAGTEKMLKLVSNLRGKEALADGALWSRGGFTVTPASNWQVLSCGCYTSRFGLDYYGRVFMPDNGRFGVQVLDSAGHPILFFGSYGNADSAGAGSALEKPDIPLAWPVAVSPGKSGVYVSDFINRRILRVELAPAVEALCPMP